MPMSDRIKELRLAAGLTQEELGEKLGLQKSAIAKYEKGRVENIKRSTIQAMAELFGVSPSYVLGFDDEQPDAQPYYLDPETAQLAQELYTRPEMRVLFDASRNASKEDIEQVASILEKLSQKQDNKNDTL